MLQLLRRYLRLMRIHDFSYHYSGDISVWLDENQIRIKLITLRRTLVLTSRGRWFVAKAEGRYGYV